MERIEIRLFGPLMVRRADGSVVQHAEWRTAKNVELLRLLAIDAGRPVPVETILATLWPDSDDRHGQASLRTAVSHIRKVLHHDSIGRESGSLLLQKAWVDVTSYSSLLDEVDRARRADHHAATVALVRQAEAVYIADVEAPASSGQWLTEAQETWRSRRCEALLDAAEAAAAVHWMRDSLDFARTAFKLERRSERAARALMRAFAGLGEMDRALSVFERVKRDLAESFGVDPSPQTRALHLQLLTGTVDRSAGSGFVGHQRSVDALVAAIVKLRGADGRAGIIWLRGEQGSGRESVAQTACEELGLSLHNMNRDPVGTESALEDGPQFVVPSSEVVVMPRTGSVSAQALGVLASLVRRQRLVLVVPTEQPVEPGLLAELAPDVSTGNVEVEPLADDELLLLTRSVLQGEPAPRLLRALRLESGSLAGAACSVARSWLGEGRIVWTPGGLDVRSRDEVLTGPLSGALRRSLRLLVPEAIDVLGVVAIGGRGRTERDVAAVVGRLYPDQSVDVSDLLDSLIDGALIEAAATGFQLRDNNARREIVDWLRPSTRRRVHCLVAELIALEPAVTVRHWIDGGMHQQACDVGVAALREASQVGDRAAMRSLVDVLHQLSPSLQATASNQTVAAVLTTAERALSTAAGAAPWPKDVRWAVTA